MKKLFELIGVIIFTAFIMAIPICCALSFALHWGQPAQFLLTVVCICEFMIVATLIGTEYID